MVIASESPAWLDTLGQIAGTILVVELSIALLIVAALAVGIAYGVYWLRRRVIPVLSQNTPRILDAKNGKAEKLAADICLYQRKAHRGLDNVAMRPVAWPANRHQRHQAPGVCECMPGAAF